jgi:hypothetical protein
MAHCSRTDPTIFLNNGILHLTLISLGQVKLTLLTLSQIAKKFLM